MGVVSIAVVTLAMSPPNTSSFVEDVRDVDWVHEIEAKGPTGAYVYLEKLLATQNASTQHGVAHQFGAALYQIEGVGAITVCGDQFLYGCMHEFVGRAIFDGGLAVAHSLNTQCEGVVLCEHAVGHGLLAYMGYGWDGAKGAVAVCERHDSVNGFFSGCGGGVFMEYFTRSMISDANVPFEGGFEEAQAFCSQFSGEVKGTCYFWFIQSMVGDAKLEAGVSAESLFSKVAQLCDVLDAEMRVYCVAAAGQASVSVGGYTAMGLPALCDLVVKNNKEIALCRSYAGRVLEGTVSRDEAIRICNGLVPPTLGDCIEKISALGAPTL